MLVKSSIEEFSRVLGSSAPAPGGGSVAALSGALGANLVSMVCNLSIGKNEYKDFEDVLKKILDKSQFLAKSLLERVDLDTEAFNSVMAAYKMPKETEEEKNKRVEAIQAGYKKAVQSPLAIAVECLEVLRIAEQLLGKFNTNALSDLGVGVRQAHAGLEGAVMNVKINLPSIKDQQFVSEISAKIAALLEEGNKLNDKIYRFVQENLG